MNNQELLNYIKVQLQAGFSKAMIYQSLRESNWPDEVIDQAFAVVENKPLPTSMEEQVKRNFHWRDKMKLLVISVLMLSLIGGSFFAWQVWQNKQAWQKEKQLLSEMELINNQNEQLVSEEGQLEATQTARSTDGQSVIISPREAWLEMKETFRNLQSYDELEAYTLKYGDQGMVDNLQEQRKQVDKMPKLAKDQLVKLAQSVVPNDEITVIDETVENDLAFLKVYTVNPKLTAEIKLIKRGEEWKLQSEEWISEE